MKKDLTIFWLLIIIFINIYIFNAYSDELPIVANGAILLIILLSSVVSNIFRSRSALYPLYRDKKEGMQCNQ